MEQEISVVFTGNGAGRVVSNPPGIDCITGQLCGPTKFSEMVTLTAMTIEGEGLEVGNHFSGWYPIDDWSKSCAKADTPNVCTLLLPAANEFKQVTVQFTQERCFGGIGSGCDGAPFNWTTTNINGKVTASVSVGSIQHDTCCLLHPLGYACQGFGTKTADENRFCQPEWNKSANFNAGTTRKWRYSFGPYLDNNVGDDLTGVLSNVRGYSELPDTLKLSAPTRTELNITDAAYCQSRIFASISTFWQSGICQ
ncbi:MAG: hypothetical protein HC877_08145 [Thioploca sp.]|nr:hypothetical protein [Thioploca sp.]